LVFLHLIVGCTKFTEKKGSSFDIFVEVSYIFKLITCFSCQPLKFFDNRRFAN
jgi:hypothetical protein